MFPLFYHTNYFQNLVKNAIWCDCNVVSQLEAGAIFNLDAD